MQILHKLGVGLKGNKGSYFNVSTYIVLLSLLFLSDLDVEFKLFLSWWGMDSNYILIKIL